MKTAAKLSASGVQCTVKVISIHSVSYLINKALCIKSCSMSNKRLSLLNARPWEEREDYMATRRYEIFFECSKKFFAVPTELVTSIFMN